MPTSRATLVTHPVRARILTALAGRRLTTQQLAALLPDVPLPSLYRHVRALAEGGAIAAVDEVRVHGALTKVFAVQTAQANLDADDLRDATLAEHLQYFTSFQASLAQLFRTYLEREAFDADTTPLHALMEPLYLSAAEYPAFMKALNAFLTPWREKTPEPERYRLLFAHIILPDRKEPAPSGEPVETGRDAH